MHPNFPGKVPLRFLSSILWLLIPPLIPYEASAESCRHLGVIEIKIGSEHCGYLDPDRKLSARNAACTLADQQKEVLQREAQAGVSTCHSADCPGRWRRWENTYTHVISQNCWTECGWAWVVDCDSPPTDEAEREVNDRGSEERTIQDREES